jgi:hypothetical protein
MSWARALQECDPRAASWVHGAFAALERIGPDLFPTGSALCAGRLEQNGAGPSHRRELLIYCQLQISDRITYVRRCLLVGPPGPLTAITFRCAVLTSVSAMARVHRAPGRIAPAAARLLATTTRLLPAAHRARYGEEFRSELWEISHAGGGGRTQLAYACRQIAASLRLRMELRSLRPGKVIPPGMRKDVLKRTGKAASIFAPAALLARLGLPALAALVFLAVIVLAACCWVISSPARSDRMARIILARRVHQPPRPGACSRAPLPAARECHQASIPERDTTPEKGPVYAADPVWKP